MSDPLLTRKYAQRPVLVASHPRSGTHLAMDVMLRQFASCQNWRLYGLPVDHLYLNIERLGAKTRRFSDKHARQIINRPRRALLKTHYCAEFTSSWVQDESNPIEDRWRNLVTGAHVMASYHQFLSAIDPSVSGSDLMSFMQTLHWVHSTDRLGWWQMHVHSWSTRPNVRLLRYEDLVKEIFVVIEKMSLMLEEMALNKTPMLPPRVTSVFQTRVDRLLRLSPQSTAIVDDRHQFPAMDWGKILSNLQREEVSMRLESELKIFGYFMEVSPYAYKDLSR